RWSDRVAQGAVVAIMLLIVGNVLLRIVWKPILGTYDLVSFLGAALISFALAHCAAQKGHVAIGVVVERLSQRAQAITDSITGIFSVAIFLVISWQCIVYATKLWQDDVLSVTLMVPYFPIVYGVGFACILLSLVLLVGFFKSVAKAVKK
ncbi:unnamed protein product, partial [marine sediment metagenome]